MPSEARVGPLGAPEREPELVGPRRLALVVELPQRAVLGARAAEQPLLALVLQLPEVRE